MSFQPPSYSAVRSMDYIRSYRSMLYDLSKYQRIVPRLPSKAKVYKPSMTINTTDATSVFVPLFYAGEKGALGAWEKTVGTGFVKRRLDEDDRSYHVLEMSNPRNNMGTYITVPRSALEALHITLPHMVMAMKNYKRHFGFDVLIMDSNAYRRRFSFATWYNPSSLKRYSFLCQVPLRLEIGWNEIHVNLNDLVKQTYKTIYVETIRIQVYANCKLRQIFFCDDAMYKGEVPIPCIKDFGNIRVIPLDYGPRTHPDGIEPGPEKKRNLPYIDPPAQVAPSRIEQDLKLLQRRRFADVSKQRLTLQPYKTYFRDLIQEEKQKKKLSHVIQAALKEEKILKAITATDDHGGKKVEPSTSKVLVKKASKSMSSHNNSASANRNDERPGPGSSNKSAKAATPTNQLSRSASSGRVVEKRASAVVNNDGKNNNNQNDNNIPKTK